MHGSDHWDFEAVVEATGLWAWPGNYLPGQPGDYGIGFEGGEVTPPCQRMTVALADKVAELRRLEGSPRSAR